MPGISAGDTCWVLIASALVMFMVPGLALFYGGMVRSKNVMATIMQSFFMMGVISVLWVLIGYTLAFGPDKGHLIGGLEWIGLRGVGKEPSAYAPTVPHLAFMIFQCMFAVITPALITGAFAERMKFKGFLLFSILWLLLVYCPVAHWVWGEGGWLKRLGTLDFAGGIVVHANSGIAALVAAILLGHRRGYGREPFVPHNLTLTLLGAGILWFGWFGFNAGSALSATDGVAACAFVATNLGAAAGMIAWVLAETLHRGTPTTLGAATGAIAGLATITPAAGFVSPLAAIVIGLVAGGICYAGVLAKQKLRYDDSLDVVGVHGVGGVTGALLVGLFASTAINPAGANGLISGGAKLLGAQVIGVLAVVAYSFVMSFVLLKLIKATVGLRASEEEEETGLDLSEHSETGYAM